MSTHSVLQYLVTAPIPHVAICSSAAFSATLTASLLPFVQTTTLLSADSMEETPKNAWLFGGQQISQDLLNKIAPSGMLPHKLTLKEGALVVLLRNMHGAHGQANGTRMPIRKIHSRVIEAEIVTGGSIGKVVFIPRINSNPTGTALAFKFRRRQFPLRSAFGMTINKAQGQTLHCPAFICPLIASLMVNCMWPRLGSGLKFNVPCEWSSSVALRQGQRPRRSLCQERCSQGAAVAVMRVKRQCCM